VDGGAAYRERGRDGGGLGAAAAAAVQYGGQPLLQRLHVGGAQRGVALQVQGRRHQALRLPALRTPPRAESNERGSPQAREAQHRLNTLSFMKKQFSRRTTLSCEGGMGVLILALYEHKSEKASNEVPAYSLVSKWVTMDSMRAHY
jgi:hypothetical protein